MTRNSLHFKSLSRLALGVSSIAVMVAAGTAPALAQSEPVALEEIVVTGFRKSLLDSVEAKRTATQIVEAISAEDIGKLPDNSIAEALSRLPGIATQRVDGRAQTVSLRGLGPDFTSTLLNGREQVSTGNNRSVEYDQYPSELLGQVLVYKTGQADVVGQGLAGTVDMRTIRPLDRNEPVFALSGRGELVSKGKINDDSDELGYRVSGAYIGQFADDTLGVSIGVAHLQQPTQIEFVEYWGYPTTDDGDALPGGVKILGKSNLLKRTGASATLQYEPTDNFSTTVDLYYSSFKEDQTQRGGELPLIWGGLPLQPGATVADGFVTEGRFDGVKAVIRGDETVHDSDLFAAGWNGEYQVDGGWTITGDVSYSTIERTSDILETTAGTGRASQGLGATDSITFSRGSDFGWQFAPTLDYSNRDLIQLTAPQNWGGVNGRDQDGFLKINTVEDELLAFRGEVEKDLDSWVDAIKVGVNYSIRNKDYAPQEYFLLLSATATDPGASVAIPDAAYAGSVDLGYIGLGDVVAYDATYLLDNGFYDRVANRNGDVLIKTWGLDEDVVTGYVMADIDTRLGEVGLTGNIGVQIVHTEQSSSGNLVDSLGGTNVVTPYTDGAEYTEFLPSLNFVFAMPNEDHKIRLGLSRQMARARPDELSASFSYSFTTGQNVPGETPWAADGGNPQLKPWIANAADLSYEYYFAAGGYFALSGFYKDLENYIYEKTEEYDFTGFQYPTAVTPVTFIGGYTRPVNGKGGELYGFEAAVSLPFDVFAESLEGFGVTANVGYTKTAIKDESGVTRSLPGYSKWTPQGTFYYDKDGFSARVSAIHRSKYLAEVTGFGAGREFREGRGETVVDAQVSYEFLDGSLEGLTLLLQGNNLTDEPFETYLEGNTGLVKQVEKYGARYLFGASYKF